jgi:hypothetical protein
MSSKDLKEEAYKVWRARAAEESEQRRQQGTVALWLERDPNEAGTFTHECQSELHEVVSVLREQGIEFEAPFLAVDAVDAVCGYTGQFIISLAQVASPVLTATLVAWIKRNPSRKIRVEFHPSGKLKTIEAQTDEQVLSIAKALDQEARVAARKPVTK